MRSPLGSVRRTVASVAVGAMVAVATPSGVATASTGENASGQIEEKTLVCHLDGMITLEIAVPDLDDHLAHGDSAGACPVQATVDYTCSMSGLAYERYYVSPEDGKGPQLGSAEAPFSSVSQAVEAARRRKVAALEIQVAAGTYPAEQVSLSVPTRIVGPGLDSTGEAILALSILNERAAELGVQGVVLADAGAGYAIRVDNANTTTDVCDVRIDGIEGVGLRQLNGHLVVDGLTVAATQAGLAPPTEVAAGGSALVIEGGVAEFANLHVTGSEGSAVVAHGPSTSVSIDGMLGSPATIEDGSGCTPAILVAGGSSLDASHLVVANNTSYGINAIGAGTLAVFNHLTVTGTTYAGGTPESSAETCGFNAVANMKAEEAADVQVFGTPEARFEISDSFAGIIITGDDPSATVTLEHGLISNHVIGVSIDGDCENLIETDVAFTDNDLDIDAEGLCLPPPLPEFTCGNGLDDDGDGLIDCDDPDCSGAPDCVVC